MGRVMIAIVLSLAACSGGTKATPQQPVESTTAPPTTAPTTAPTTTEPTAVGWSCFSVTGVHSSGRGWANSECVRDAAACEADMASMSGGFPDDGRQKFVGCNPYTSSYCYPVDTRESASDQLCFISERDCNASVDGLRKSLVYSGACAATP